MSIATMVIRPTDAPRRRIPARLASCMVGISLAGILGWGLRWGRALKRARHTQHMLAQVRQDEVGRDGRDLIQPRLAELPLNVIFRRESKPSMGLQARVGRLP